MGKKNYAEIVVTRLQVDRSQVADVGCRENLLKLRECSAPTPLGSGSVILGQTLHGENAALPVCQFTDIVAGSAASPGLQGIRQESPAAPKAKDRASVP